MLYQVQEEVDNTAGAWFCRACGCADNECTCLDDGSLNNDVTGCEDTDEDDWMDSPTDFDEHEMNADDSADAHDVYDIEYDR